VLKHNETQTEDSGEEGSKTCADSNHSTPTVTCDGGTGSLLSEALSSEGSMGCSSPFGSDAWTAKCTPDSGYVDTLNGKCMTMAITFPGEMAAGLASMVTYTGRGKGKNCGYDCIWGPACTSCCNYDAITCKNPESSDTYCEFDVPSAFTNFNDVFDNLPPSSLCPMLMTSTNDTDECTYLNRTYSLDAAASTPFGEPVFSMNCKETFGLNDFEAPVFNTSLFDITMNCNASANPEDYFDPQPEASNSCYNHLNVTFYDAQNHTCGDAYQPGVYTRTWKATDQKCGGTANITQTVTIIDDAPPITSCDGSPLTQSLCETFAAASASYCPFKDACTGEILEPNVTCCQASDGSIERTWEAMDACGNTGSITRNISFVSQQ